MLQVGLMNARVRCDRVGERATDSILQHTRIKGQVNIFFIIMDISTVEEYAHLVE